MGAWRAFMSRARGQTRHSLLSPSSSRIQQQSLLCPIARFETLSHDACTPLNGRIWPGLGLMFPGSFQKEARQDAETLLENAKEFIQLIQKDLGRPDLCSSIRCFQVVDQKKTWLHERILGQEQETLASNEGYSADVKNIFSNSTDEGEFDCFFSAFDAAISVPGFHESEDFNIQADSVKRKRKKKMNKHKHRKLRRLARKSHK